VTTVRIPLARPLDLARTLGPHRRGYGDPTLRIDGQRAWRATRTPDGPASVAIAVYPDHVRGEAYGPGAARALDALPALLGLDRPPERGTLTSHRLLGELARRHPGVHIGRTGAVMEALVPAILEQKVTGDEARTGFRRLVATLGEEAPGPPALRLRLPPTPERLTATPYHVFHPFGIERRRADLVRRAAARANWYEALVDLPLPDAYSRLTALPGLGPWTAAEVAVRALGDLDAVSVGDYHIPNLVSWALAGEPRGTDARMLELLEPFRPFRAIAVRLLEVSGIRAPRYGPRYAPRGIEAM
jgi:3-methyladenine DNA glycosylase/8-oxoguanine DNA glycosylase